ncbi:MAG: hypothetical protein V2A54_18000 [Bacteroidota bacterium]
MKKKFLFTSILAVLLASLSYYFYHHNIRMFPAYMHAWTQSDRYSLSLGYVDNNLNFFQPNMNNIMPNPDFVPEKAAETGITAVDFPMNEYIVAAIMTVSGSTKPLIFRLFILLYSLLGLFYLFRFSLRNTASPVSSYFVLIFVFTAPVFCYYQNGFLPSITAVANMFIGWFYYSHYYEKKRSRNLYAAILFFTLAALTRKPFLIFLFSIFLYHLYQFWKTKKLNKPVCIAFGASFGAIVLVSIYNYFLSKNYGNAFLGSLMPGESFEEYGSIIKQIFNSWFHTYLTSYHYIALGVIFLTGLYFIKKHGPRKGFHRFLLYQALIGMLFSVVYFAAMAKQFIAHDYYFLDSFFVPITLLLIYFLSSIREVKVIPRIPWPIIFAIFSLLFVMQNKKIQARRYTTGPWDRIEITRQNFKGSAEFLDKLGISRDTRILVLDAYTTNMPLIQLERKGFALLDTKPEKIKRALDWNYDFVVIQNQFLISDVVDQYPPIINRLIKIGDNGKISVFKRRDDSSPQAITAFLGIRNENILFTDTLFSDSLLPRPVWKSADKISKATFLSASQSGILDPGIEYSATLSLTSKDVISKSVAELYLNASFYSATSDFEGIEVVMSLDDNGKQTAYSNFPLKDYLKGSKGWQGIQLMFTVPPIDKAGQELKLYFWNPKKKTVFYDDVQVILFRPN